jgi:hypothetical protein
LVLRGLGRFVVERHGGRSGALAFLPGDELPQFLGVVHHRTVVRVFDRPFSKVVTKPVHVVTGLGGQLILDPPDFFEDRIRFQVVILPWFSTARSIKRGAS